MLQGIMCIYHNPELLENLHFPENIKNIPLIYTQSERLERFQLSLNFIIYIFLFLYCINHFAFMFSNNFVENWLKYDLFDLFLLYIVYLLGKIYTFFSKLL